MCISHITGQTDGEELRHRHSIRNKNMTAVMQFMSDISYTDFRVKQPPLKVLFILIMQTSEHNLNKTFICEACKILWSSLLHTEQWTLSFLCNKVTHLRFLSFFLLLLLSKRSWLAAKRHNTSEDSDGLFTVKVHQNRKRIFKHLSDHSLCQEVLES